MFAGDIRFGFGGLVNFEMEFKWNKWASCTALRDRWHNEQPQEYSENQKDAL